MSEEKKAPSTKYVWKIVVQNPKKDGDDLTMHGTGANISVAISKAKKKAKEKFKIKTDNMDLTVTHSERLHTIEF